MISRKSAVALAVTVVLALACTLAAFAQSPGPVKGAIGVDGMHVLDYLNCSKGISTINGGESYCPNLAELDRTGVNYLDTSTSKLSDSFPGLMALVTGGHRAPWALSMTSPMTACLRHLRSQREMA